MSYRKPLRLEIDREAKLWTLLTEARYDMGFKGSGDTLIIPEGFKFNGASIPSKIKFFFFILGVIAGFLYFFNLDLFYFLLFFGGACAWVTGNPMDIQSLRAALFHDYGYEKELGKIKTDLRFWDMLMIDGNGVFKSTIYYLVVTI